MVYNFCYIFSTSLGRYRVKEELKLFEVSEMMRQLRKIGGGVKKFLSLFIISIILFNLFIITSEPFSICNPAHGLRFESETNITNSDITFSVFKSGQIWGRGGGDVNGDGFDDIVIGSPGCAVPPLGGRAFLVFGTDKGWSKDINLSKKDVSFIAENAGDFAGYTVACNGDVNGDGYDDILIGSYGYGGGLPSTGKVHIIFGKCTGWKKNISLYNANASFIGNFSDGAAFVDFAGDVNGDGFDDILIGAPFNSDVGHFSGKVYLIFGRANGWAHNMTYANINASFLGESGRNQIGKVMSGAGDVNGDGFDDFLMSSPYVNERGNYTGQTYLILGKAGGWSRNVNVSKSDASFIGEEQGCMAGRSVAGGGDFNNDGFDDFVIGADRGPKVPLYAGKTYVIFGKASGWTIDTNLTSANATYIGENSYDFAGESVAVAGDVDNDGYDDILVGSTRYKKYGYRVGKVYLILGSSNNWNMNNSLLDANASFIGPKINSSYIGQFISGVGDFNNDGNDDIFIYNGFTVHLIFPTLYLGPATVNSVRTYSDISCINEISVAAIGDIVYVELIGTDEDSIRIEKAAVNISSEVKGRENITAFLTETGASTGVFRGNFKITNEMDGRLGWFKGDLGKNITVTSIMDPTKNAKIFVSVSFGLRPILDITSTVEDNEYNVTYWSVGIYPATEWVFYSDADWLFWDSNEHRLFGIPNNGDIGTFWVLINITDGLGHFDEHYFELSVSNTPPNITNKNIDITFEDKLYHVDYSSSDDDNGSITWKLETNASWLEFDHLSGELSGTPTNDDIGIYHVNISVDDGNGGFDWSEFELTVIDTNDPPEIITENVTTVYEDNYYLVEYSAIDIDGEKDLKWNLFTNASWLYLDKDSGKLYGVPTNDHVGTWFVNVSVIDPRGGFDYQNYSLQVINVNDQPEWTKVPSNFIVNETDYFTFDVDALDIDSGDVLAYSISSKPEINITIDPGSGIIHWNASIDNLNPPHYSVELNISVTDGIESIQCYFFINVLPNLEPTTNLLSPLNNTIVSMLGIELKWTGYDETSDPIKYNLYLSSAKSAVIDLDKTALILYDTEVTSHLVTGLEIGQIYYWSVIPKDHLRYGECLDKIFNFEVNSPPKLLMITKQLVYVGDEFLFDVEASDHNIEQVGQFEFELENAPEGMKIQPSTGIITWTPSSEQLGNYIINVWVSDGIDRGNLTFEIKVTERPVEDRASFPTFVVFTSLIILIIVIVNIGIYSTEIGKYKFLSLFFVPLYNKLHRDKVFDNYTRGKIHGYIQAKPGEHYNAIKYALKLKNGTLTHHTRILEKEGFIKVKRDRLLTRFYPMGVQVPEEEKLELKEVQEELLDIIEHQPGITQREIIELLDLGQPAISYNLTNLTRNNLIRSEQDGREKKYYLNPRSEEYLDNKNKNNI
jgi:predicted transcriptional regulator